MVVTHIDSAQALKDWFDGRTGVGTAAPVEGDGVEPDADGSDAEDMDEEDEGGEEYRAHPPRAPYNRYSHLAGHPSATSRYGVLLFTGAPPSVPESLSTMSLLRVLDPLRDCFPHVSFAYGFYSLPGFSKGSFGASFEVSLTPTVVLFNLSTRRQVDRRVGDMLNLHDFTERLPSLLQQAPLSCAFSGVLGGGPSTYGPYDCRHLRLSRLEARPQPPAAAAAVGGSGVLGGPATVGVDPRQARLARLEQQQQQPPPFVAPVAAGASSSRTPFSSSSSSDGASLARGGAWKGSDDEEQRKIEQAASRQRELEKATKEKEDRKRERERLQRQLEEDKAERRERGGKLNSKLGPDGYSPDCLQKNFDGWVGAFGEGSAVAAGSQQQGKPPPPDALTVARISAEKLLRGYPVAHFEETDGRSALQLADKIIGNVLAHPEEVKYRSINITTKIFVNTLKTKLGGKALMAAAGFREGEEGRWVLESGDDGRIDAKLLKDVSDIIKETLGEVSARDLAARAAEVRLGVAPR